MENQKIIVIGGNGFIGREICKLAVSQGHEVFSISRSGKPQVEASWTGSVNWIQADILEPEQWRTQLEGCDAVIHAVGILFEQPEAGVTFERINGDAAIAAANEAQKANIAKFVFISAQANPPFVAQAYLTAKRRAEVEIQKQDFSSAILRPALVYGPDRAPSVVLAKISEVAALIPIWGKTIEEYRPLHVEVVARTALRAALEPNITGIIDIEKISQLGKGAIAP